MVTHHLAKVAYTSSNLACCFFLCPGAIIAPVFFTQPLFGSSLAICSCLLRYLIASTAALAADVVVV